MNKTSRTSLFLARRTAAIVILLLGFWLLQLCAGTNSALLSLLGEHPGFLRMALAVSLGTPPQGETEEGAPSWPRYLLAESGLLSGFSSSRGQMQRPQGEEELDLSSTKGGEVVEKFFTAAETDTYARTDDIYILNKTQKQLDLPALAAMAPQIALKQDEGPQVLLMHTHGSEAYTPEGDDQYQATGVARTTDPNYNTIRVGDEIERIFTEMGLVVLHDKTLYDYPSYNGSYERSKEAVAAQLAQHPSIQVVIDLHRDALIGSDGTVYKPVVEIDGQKSAQVMLVVGTDEGGAQHPNWQHNLSFSMRVQHRMNMLWPGLARPMNLRSSSFNQQLTAGCILVEVGSHGNSLQEALAAARLFARSAGQVLLELQQ